MAVDRKAVGEIFDRMKAEKRTALTPPEGRIVCEAYGIPLPREGLATSASEAAELANSLQAPLVMKIVSPDILHKTEAGGVTLGVKTPAEAQEAYETILENAGKYQESAQILGVQVQEMAPRGTEVIVGAVTDPSFGKLVAFGLGG